MSFSRLSPPLFVRFMVVLACALTTAGLRAADDSEPRFSSTLSPTQRAETGLDQLTSDNVAVIDALVRLDTVAATRLLHSTIRSTRFSQRHTAHECEIAGFARLTDAQLTKLDQFVALRIPAPPVALSADLPYATIGFESPPAPVKRPSVEIHGSFSLTYGWSKGGSVRGGNSTVTMVDPKHRFALTVGYSEYRGNGLAPYPPYLGDSTYVPYYRPLPVIMPDDPDR